MTLRVNISRVLPVSITERLNAASELIPLDAEGILSGLR